MDLEALKREQLSLRKKLNLRDSIKLDEVRYVAGIDLTYLDVWKNPTIGIACAVVLDLMNDLNVVEVEYAIKSVDFPYIPTFLAYRELPLVLEVTGKLENPVDVFMLDGMGIMHPRRMGIAAHFGVVQDVVSLGCAKSYLVGDYKEPANVFGDYRPVFVDGELRGFALRSKKNARPIFISPGNNITPHSALKLTLLCLDGYKVPKPTRLAHNYLQQYRKNLLSG